MRDERKSIINIYTDKLPGDARVRHIRGNWMLDGYINNYNRNRRFVCVVKDGLIYEVDNYGYLDLTEAPLGIAEDDEIMVRGIHITFSPEPGELVRIGVRGRADTEAAP